MTRLAWNEVGERLFETGVQHGVLYLEGRDGVPWNGLIRVSESSSGGEVTPRYIDGIKYYNQVSSEEFEATLEAFTYPDEFAECDGTSQVANGLFATQQRRKSFGLCYKTNVGNDVDGSDYAYKIHLVYNATASPTERANNTVAESIQPSNFSWHISTKPPRMVGYKPTSHFVIDSRETPSDLLNDLEDILYGSDVSDARLPSIGELFFLFQDYEDSGFDGGLLVDDEYFAIFDEGTVGEPYTSTLDGGAL